MKSVESESPFSSLDELGLKHGTDKSSSKHNYLCFYEEHLQHLRKKPIKLLEIGVFNGSSLRMWQEYFCNGFIVGVDNKPHTQVHSGERIVVRFADQAQPETIAKVSEELGPFDIIIDDGSHIWSHQIGTMRTMLPMVKPGGIYILEDLQTSFGSYKENYGKGGGPTGAAFVLSFCERIIGDRFADADPNGDDFLNSASKLVKQFSFAGRTAIFLRR